MAPDRPLVGDGRHGPPIQDRSSRERPDPCLTSGEPTNPLGPFKTLRTHARDTHIGGTMTVSHWGIFPGMLWERNGVTHWRELSFDFWCLLT